MNNYLQEFSRVILSLHRYSKRTIALITDIAMCILCTWLAFCLRLEEVVLLRDFNILSAIITIIIALPIFWIFGLYRTIYRYTNFSIIFNILASIIIYGLIYFLIIGVYSIQGIPRSIVILQPMLLFFGISSSRLAVKFLLQNNFGVKKLPNKKNLLIYGAGNAGRQLFVALQENYKYKVLGFLDDNNQIHRQSLLGTKNLEELKDNKDINIILYTIKKKKKNKKNEIIKKISNYKIQIKTLPKISDIIDGKLSFSDLKDFLIEDLLDREPVQPNYDLLKKNIKLKTILVTGAGGTIGSELSKQILKLKPKKLILFELNEYALFKINEEFFNLFEHIEIIPLIGNILDQKKLEIVFKTFEVDTVYHAAAYKHVPLVENNICEGVKNNVLGTLSVVKAAINKNVKDLVLISSDKAVRPTNIMGASKRFAELCLQVYNNKSSLTNFSIVRFGNVLASSGSVIPKFKQQIITGGPVTLTHNDVTRYFMTVSEAAQLVIQAGALGKNSEVFVLDMGKSIKIRDMIIKMINLSGQKLKDENNLDGDIEIKVTGLRPGEKLYEELLIGDNPKKTIHPKIQKINEPSMTFDQFEKGINDLTISLDNHEPVQVKKILDRVVRFYNSNSEMVDYIYNEKRDVKYTSQNKDKNNVVKLK